MAEQDHLDVLAHGVKAWNAWRSEESTGSPDLSGADLNGLQLVNINLRGANLENVNLSRCSIAFADLRGANLGDADLRYSSFADSRLTAANLINADLRKTDLSGADLGRANLAGARLEDTRLTGTNFEASVFGGTSFGNVDLSEARNIESAIHWAPSKISIDTVYQSRGCIAEGFLRGAGVPENFISYMKSLGGAAFEFYSCFISYSTVDQEFAERLYADLQARGVRCWFAPHNLQGGRKVHEQIDEAIRLYEKLLLILSDASMSSNWVKTEIANARAKEAQQARQMLFPISLVSFDRIRSWKLFDADTGIDSAREIREYFVPDFSNWKDHDSYQQAFDRLVKDLKATPPSKLGV